MSEGRERRPSTATPHVLFLRHRAHPGRRAELIEMWRRFMPAAVSANPGHQAYSYCAAHSEPDVLLVFQQYCDAAAAAEFLAHPAYLAYLEASRDLLAGPPEIETAEPLWSKAVGPAGSGQC